MSEQSSMAEASAVLVQAKNDMFWLTCTCGWGARETRDWVMNRIRQHFATPDAVSTEHVTVEPGPATVIADAEAGGGPR